MRNVRIIRRLRAEPSAVFDLLVTAQGIAKWWGPDAGPVLQSEAEARVGGKFRLRFRTLSGVEYEVGGEFLELKAHERVRMRWLWASDAVSSEIEMHLRPLPEGTELTFIHDKLPDEKTACGHEKGWNGSLDKLEAVLSR